MTGNMYENYKKSHKNRETIRSVFVLRVYFTYEE